MKKTILGIASLAIITLMGCGNSSSKSTQAVNANTQKQNVMNNLVSIIEIPVTDFDRALKFYQSIMGVTIEKMVMEGNSMGVFPVAEGAVNVVLIKGEDYKPTTEGALLYLNAGEDLQPMLDRIVQGGGRVILPKTEISPEMGYFALFVDSEGNKLGLHSVK